jgi:hypothetical protein
VIRLRTVLRAGIYLGSLTIVAVAMMTVMIACSNGDDGADPSTAPAESAVAQASAATDDQTATDATDGEAGSEPTAAAAPVLDFGSGTGSITLGDETFDLAVGPGTGICRDVFDMIQASGKVTDGRDIQGDFSIPPLDWESYEDQRYDPPSVELEITSTGDDNADWRADARWAEQFDKVGQSQVDSYEKDGLTASGTATFANAWDASDESVQGSFEISCAEE